MLDKNAAEKRADISSAAEEDVFARDVIEGLSREQKTLPCRYLYDARGSDLFERITEQEEYYPTRVETGILSTHARDIVDGASADGVVVEFGSGSSRKTELLLNELPAGAAYVPIDVSPSALEEAAMRLGKRYPALDVRPVVADFSEPVQLPPDLRKRPKIGFFPGSTIGNLVPAQAERLLARFRKLLSSGGRLIVGVDLKKDPRTLIRAYNDSSGVTAAFNLNLLDRINREIEPAFDVDAFTHDAIYNAREGRMEMHLVCTRDQEFEIRGHRFGMRAGETIHTENSYKYTVDRFQEIARCAGWSPRQVWTDQAQRFSVHELLTS